MSTCSNSHQQSLQTIYSEISEFSTRILFVYLYEKSQFLPVERDSQGNVQKLMTYNWMPTQRYFKMVPIIRL